MANDLAMLAGLNKAASAVAGRRSRDASNLCEQYAKIRKWIVMALPLIKKIPIYGAQIAAVLEFLMSIADTVCPTAGVRVKR